MSSAIQPKKPVIIVGAGLAGLVMAILFERMNIPYQIYERAAKVKPLGALMSLGNNILAVFEQLGFYDELIDISLPMMGMTLYKENMEQIGIYGPAGINEIAGYDSLAFPRPKLYDLILSKVPKERISFSKKIVSFTESFETKEDGTVGGSSDGITIHCSDGTSYEGSILIGADGAYSGIRQALYDQMERKGVLPQSDKESLAVNYVCMVGTSEPMDPEKYPVLKDDISHVAQVVGENKSYSWTSISVKENRICWSVVQQLPDTLKKEDIIRNSEWGPEACESTIQEVSSFTNGFGGTLGELIENTPRENISKVMLEEKLFQTWYYGRTVLIGDAAHKMLPSAGQGAVNAMQDAVILANCLYDLESYSSEALTAAFDDYWQQRHPQAKFQFEVSKFNGKIMSGQTWWERVIRKVVFNYLPLWAHARMFIKSAAYRPQIAFLPEAPRRGTVDLLPLKPSVRYTLEQEAKKKEVAVGV